MLDKYEELNLDNYVEGDPNKMVFGNTENEGEKNIKEQVSSLCDNLRNPYFNMYHWAKGELFDIEAITIALNNKDKLSEKMVKNEKNKKSTQDNIENVQAGRKTLKTLLKSQNDIGTMNSKVERVSNLNHLVYFMLVLYYRLIKKMKHFRSCWTLFAFILVKKSSPHSRRKSLEFTLKYCSNLTLCKSIIHIRLPVSGAMCFKIHLSRTQWKNETKSN